MKVIFVYSSVGMNALLPSTGTRGQQGIQVKNVGFGVGHLRTAEPTAGKASAAQKMTKKQTGRREKGAHPVT